MDLIAKEIHNSGDIGIVSAAASATNQNAWIAAMKQELKKFPKVHLVATVYGNDDPTTATQVTQGLLQRYPNLKGIIAPTSVGIVSAAQVVSSSKYKGKVLVTGLGTPESMKKYVANGVAPAFFLWDPAGPRLPGRLRRGELRVQEDHQRAGSDVHGRQARQIHGRRGQHDPARPAA